MNSKLKTLLNRQRELKAKIAKERFKLADHFKPIERVFSWADRILDGVHFMKRNPVLWTTVFAIFAAYQPSIASKLLTAGFSAVKFAKGVRNLI